MMTKFLSLLARAQVVTLDNGSVVDVEMAEVTGQPENQVVRLSCPRLNGRGSCSTMLTEEGLAAVTFDAESKFFKLDDYEGDPVVLKLTDGDEVLTPETEDVVYLVIQEGGSSCELYIHAHSTREDAEADRISCRDDGAYRTSESIIEVPESLANHPMFYESAEMQLIAANPACTYLTSKGMAELPESLVNHPMFSKTSERLLAATKTLGFPESEAE